ncbi:hypothetical protein CPC08DRAFT_729101 [Agrocybe pediades]|nr:hypothetical protein CPC08DRAFT_729101 [Agrocybe pediades]
MSNQAEADRIERKRKYRKEYYAENIRIERKKARGRAQKKKGQMSEEERTLHKENHHVAQAKYRLANRDLLNVRKRMARLQKKEQARRMEDEELYRELMEGAAISG